MFAPRTRRSFSIDAICSADRATGRIVYGVRIAINWKHDTTAASVGDSVFALFQTRRTNVETVSTVTRPFSRQSRITGIARNTKSRVRFRFPPSGAAVSDPSRRSKFYGGPTSIDPPVRGLRAIRRSQRTHDCTDGPRGRQWVARSRSRRKTIGSLSVGARASADL